MSESVYTPGADDFIKDPYVVQELARISAAFKALQSQQTDTAAEKGLEDHTTVAPTKPDNPDAAPEGVRWLSGPWLLNADGNVKGKAAIRPPAITGTVNDYAPAGIDSAIMLELDATANVDITGIKIRTRQRRFLKIVNVSGFTISLVNRSTSSQNVHQFAWGTSGDADESIGIPTGQMLELYYDTSGQKWKLFAIPAVGSDNLPATLLPPSFPPDYDAFGARVYRETAANYAGMGEAAPTEVGAAVTGAVDQYGLRRDFDTNGFINSVVGVGANSATPSTIQGIYDPTWTTLIRTGSDITTLGIWILCATVSPALANLGGASQYMGFRYYPGGGDGGWVGTSRDGVTTQVTGTVAAIAADTVYKLKMRKSGGTLYFSVNGSDELSIAVNLPTSTTTLQWYAYVEALEAVVKRIGWYRHWVKFGFTP